MKKYSAEFIGTFALVFFGTGSIIVNDQTGSLGLLGIALAFGTIITSMIYVFGNLSGAHINPAVTIALAVGKMINKKDATFYIIAQTLGAFFASILLSFIFPTSSTLGITLPSGSIEQSFILEVVLTFFLMLVILGVTLQGNKESKALAGIIIGGYIISAILVSGPISGGSFNPARSLAPAIISSELSSLWIYLTAPTLGAILAVLGFNKVL